VRLILGVGNPGIAYKNNRHNVGFMFLDYLAEKYTISFLPAQNDYYFAEHCLGESKLCLVKPSNYVNNSGISAMQALSNYNASIKDLLVIYDDVYLSVGTFRLKLSGGDGGHKGVQSIIYQTYSDQFPRIRIGAGSENFSQQNISQYVLSDFSDTENDKLKPVFRDCELLTESFILGGIKNLLDTNSKIVRSANDADFIS
jgi:PTH1 family peptidyl-tRNA hydrolase